MPQETAVRAWRTSGPRIGEMECTFHVRRDQVRWQTMLDPWSGKWERTLGATGQLPPRAELLAAIGAEVGKLGPKSGLSWEESWLEASISIRERDGFLVGEHRFALSPRFRWAVLAAVIPILLGTWLCGWDFGDWAAVVPRLALPLMGLVLGARMAARIRITRVVRRAIARARTPATREVPRATARFRG